MIKPGNVFSIDAALGKAYFQYVDKLSPFGALIRVLPEVFKFPPDIEALVARPSNFWVFFPVAAALKRGLIVEVGNYPLPEHSQKPPIFRTGTVDPRTGRVEIWCCGMVRRNGRSA